MTVAVNFQVWLFVISMFLLPFNNVNVNGPDIAAAMPSVSADRVLSLHLVTGVTLQVAEPQMVNQQIMQESE